MKTINTYVAESRNSLLVANQLLQKTFILTKDPKVLLSVVSHLRSSHEAFIKAALQTCMLTEEQTFIQNVHIVRKCLCEKLSLEKKIFNVFTNVYDVSENYEKSPVAFARKQDFVVSKDEHYDLAFITQEQLQQYITQTQNLLHTVFKNATGT